MCVVWEGFGFGFGIVWELTECSHGDAGFGAGFESCLGGVELGGRGWVVGGAGGGGFAGRGDGGGGWAGKGDDGDGVGGGGSA